MGLVYVVLAHHLPEQVARLARSLSSEGDLVLVHVDARRDEGPFRHALESVPNATLIPDRERCEWGRVGHVLATLSGLRYARSLSLDYSHAALLTGQDYPIKSPLAIREYMGSNASSSFISWTPLSIPEEKPTDVDENWVHLQRILCYHVKVNGRIVQLTPRRVMDRVRSPRLLPRRLPRDLELYCGLAYWNLSIEAVEYVLDAFERRPELARVIRTMFIPDEHIFQMLLLTSPLAHTLVNDDLRWIEWRGFHPRTVTSADLGAMVASPKLFARKFDTRVDGRVLDALDAAW